MTSHPFVGLSRPHTLAPSRIASHTQPSFNGPPSRHVLIDLTDVARPSNDDETPSKRRKIENDARAVRAGRANVQHGGSGDNLWQASGLRATPRKGTDHQGQGSFQSPSVHLSLAKTNTVEDEPPVEPQSLPPLPMRPGTLASARSYRQQRMTVYCGPSRREGVQVKPYVLDPPPFAPRFEREKVADFFPWMGNHPEDVLSEHVAKQGFYDKTQISHESNTARPSLYSIFKHKSGLHTLSTLFVSALEQRQAHGRVTACSTFKPPPRVTLTDAKREAWLKDLANPAVPLRRLSRTIPHGIRGKVLLDQCLSKDIPTTRAVWLAKCVGANEIRAFKRKGTSGTFAMGGEVKWIKDWTTCVEQFIDGVIGSCGTTEWRSKMTYAIRLSANLYSEHLIDREHYVDSVLTSFESANLDATPIWILMLQIVWKDLMKCRKYGRHLVEALLDKLNMAPKSEDRALFTPIVRRLSELTTDLLNMSPACFIIPHRWVELEAMLKSCLDPQQHSLIARFERLRQRNRRLIEVGRLHKGDSGKSQREQLIRKLDCLRAPFDVPKVSEACLEMAQNHDTAIAILLQWISTPYREDEAYVYLTVRLLRKWNKLGYDTDKPILNYLATSRNSSGLRKHNLYQVVVEMIRSRQFSVGKYCQWLLARGVLTGHCGLHKNDPCDVGLLAELPLYRLSEYSVNVRMMLLNGVSFATDDESALVQDVKNQIRIQCAELFEPATQGHTNVKRLESFELPSLSWTVKSDISHWLRQVVALRVQAGDPDAMSDWKDISSLKETSAITVEQLWFIRSILEAFQDYSILADVLNLTSSSNDQTTLASVADTVNYHFDIFSAIGAASDLFERLIERHRSLTAGRPPNKALLVSLIDLGARFPARSQTIQQLCSQLALCEQKSAVAACSPVSDHIAEALQSAKSNFNDEFEHLLTSGTSMDKHTMTRLFNTVVKRIEHAWEHSDDEIGNLGVLCSRLRIFDSKHFDGLMLVWVESLLLATSRLDLKRALSPMISAGCLSLRAVVACARTLIDGPKQKEARDKHAQVTVDMLDLIAPLADLQPYPMNQTTYRFRLEQRRFSIARPLDTIHIISKAFDLASTSGDDSIIVQLDSWLTSPRLMSLLRYLVVHETVAVQSQFFPAVENISQAATFAIKRVIDGLLDPSHEHGLTKPCLEEQLKGLIQTVDDFSLPFCQLRIRQLLELGKKPMYGNKDDAQTYVVAAIFEGAKIAVAEKNTTWPILLSVIDDEIAGQVRERAEEYLFSSILATTASQPHDDDDVLAQSKLAGEIYLSIIQALTYTIPESGAPQIGEILADKMSALAQSLQTQPPPTASHRSTQAASNQHNQQQIDYNCFWLNILLRLTILHHHPSKTTTPPTNLLLALSTLLLSPSLATNPPMLQSIFDTTSTLIDRLPPAARAQCIRSLESQTPSRNDPRIRFLFGYGGGTSDDNAGCGAGPGGAGGGNGGEGSTLRIEGKGGKVLGPMNLKAWEIIQDPAPAVGENDTFLSLALFRARKVVV